MQANIGRGVPMPRSCLFSCAADKAKVEAPRETGRVTL
ncbi:hypothetical protein PAMC26510_09135 [Caballeronia sordidicola]|uniref:Uncharacterized protein n=1 Tax=Caballeronia sordidicola TaxID=196367 RepID=A0A242N2G9_CABSO|nr:hypothetical protein PAMC26577_32165 [Caballeronia sordidicola]OTP77346.1 hypothetical protein PAMC26510_09135 [Caballeronia sordidicola]